MIRKKGQEVNSNFGPKNICWDCANATGRCPWSAGFKPIKGWTAEKVERTGSYGLITTYYISACPLFVRDAINFGQIHLKEAEEKWGKIT